MGAPLRTAEPEVSQSSGSIAGLTDILDGLRTGSSPELEENYKLLLCMAAGGLAPRGSQPSSPERRQAFEVVLKSLGKLALPGESWSGRPPLMTDELFGRLRAESAQRKLTAKPTDRYLLAKSGPQARRFAQSRKLAKLVAEHFPGVTPTGIASYIYYDNPGDGLDPHVDTEIYAVNVILMIDHEFKAKPSNLLIYKDTVVPREIFLRPGEMAIINAGSVVHARQDMGENEHVHILTVGFS